MMVTLKKAIHLIRQGEVVAFPTETVYGLGADAQNIRAIKKTFRLKGRPLDNPLIVHVSSMQQAEELTADRPEDFYKLAAAFWPGPLTLVTNKNERVPDLVTGGLQTVALRMPDHPLALQLIQRTGPLTAPSANKSGKPSPTRIEHLIQDYGDNLFMMDGGATDIGLESTVLDLTSPVPTILRPGAITAEQISVVIRKPVRDYKETHRDNSSPAKSPGIKYTHYKPDAVVEWMDRRPSHFSKNVFYIVHSTQDWPESEHIASYNRDFRQLARELYDLFRTADHLQYQKILIEKLPSEDLNPFISPLLNRISKAAGR